MQLFYWCCTAKIVHNNNDIYTYIRSQGDNLSTPQISKQAIFSQVQITTKDSLEEFASSLTTKWARLFPNMARWLCNQAHDKQRQTKWLYLCPFIPQAILGMLRINIHVKQHSNRSGRISHQDINRKITYEHHRKYFTTFIPHDRSQKNAPLLNLGLINCDESATFHQMINIYQKCKNRIIYVPWRDASDAWLDCTNLIVMNVTYQYTRVKIHLLFSRVSSEEKHVCTFHQFPFLVRHCQTTYKAFTLSLKCLYFITARILLVAGDRAVHRRRKSPVASRKGKPWIRRNRCRFYLIKSSSQS